MKPFVTATGDYHDFKDIVRHFKNAGINLDYEEVGCGYSKWWNESYGGYHAVFFEKRKKSLAYSKIKEWKAYFDRLEK